YRLYQSGSDVLTSRFSNWSPTAQAGLDAYLRPTWTLRRTCFLVTGAFSSTFTAYAMCGNRFCIAIPTGSSDPRRSLHRRWQSFSNNGCHRPKTGAKSWREQSMPPRISILIIGWVASTLSMESLCSGGTQWQASWSPPSKFDEARTCSQSGFSSDTPYSHCCFTQCQGLQLQRAEKRARCDRRQ